MHAPAEHRHELARRNGSGLCRGATRRGIAGPTVRRWLHQAPDGLDRRGPLSRSRTLHSSDTGAMPRRASGSGAEPQSCPSMIVIARPSITVRTLSQTAPGCDEGDCTLRCTLGPAGDGGAGELRRKQVRTRAPGRPAYHSASPRWRVGTTTDARRRRSPATHQMPALDPGRGADSSWTPAGPRDRWLLGSAPSRNRTRSLEFVAKS